MIRKPSILLFLFLIVLNTNSIPYFYSGSYYHFNNEVKLFDTELESDTLKINDTTKTLGLDKYLKNILHPNINNKIRSNLYFNIFINDNKIDSVEYLNDSTYNVFKLNNIDINDSFNFTVFNSGDQITINFKYDLRRENAWRESNKENAIKVGKWLLGAIILLTISITTKLLISNLND
jgi:hypothetical protein